MSQGPRLSSACQADEMRLSSPQPDDPEVVPFEEPARRSDDSLYYHSIAYSHIRFDETVGDWISPVKYWGLVAYGWFDEPLLHVLETAPGLQRTVKQIARNPATSRAFKDWYRSVRGSGDRFASLCVGDVCWYEAAESFIRVVRINPHKLIWVFQAPHTRMVEVQEIEFNTDDDSWKDRPSDENFEEKGKRKTFGTVREVDLVRLCNESSPDSVRYRFYKHLYQETQKSKETVQRYVTAGFEDMNQRIHEMIQRHLNGKTAKAKKGSIPVKVNTFIPSTAVRRFLFKRLNKELQDYKEREGERKPEIIKLRDGWICKGIDVEIMAKLFKGKLYNKVNPKFGYSFDTATLQYRTSTQKLFVSFIVLGVADV